MTTTQGLDMDMNAAVQWPGRVRLKMRIDHERGQPEEWQLALDAGPTYSVVTVFADPGLAARGEGRHVLWQDLPGRTLRMRSLSVLAVAMFDSVKMVPRICGRPMWQSVSLILSAGNELQATRMELKLDPADASRALLRHRRGTHEPWTERATVLINWDADPLRAMLRQGMVLRDAGLRPMGYVSPRSHLPWEVPAQGARSADAAPRSHAGAHLTEAAVRMPVTGQ
jgi:hypothetical protein